MGPVMTRPEYFREYYQKHKERIREYKAKRYRSDPEYRLRMKERAYLHRRLSIITDRIIKLLEQWEVEQWLKKRYKRKSLLSQ